ncbi:hypothetical protein EF912_21130 [Streptomyces sp. WAC07061]|uniref:hypothetical protein n=1 Tax=Streptomyces sp. WAC07061 TaxID=2487410 RepID=UPI000F773F03|nr:hypothetical protein [Streptomyces sp. WAC07061]RSS51100.1 hypothetical protein EF912_21130 [Streptomyces sp. WAC07061]
MSASSPFTTGQLQVLQQAALSLSTQGLELLVVNRDGPAASDCPGCGVRSPLTFRYGGPMADCRLCGYGWAVGP